MIMLTATPDNGNGRLQELRDRLLDRLAKSIDVIGVDRHNIPVLVGIEVLDRELCMRAKSWFRSERSVS